MFLWCYLRLARAGGFNPFQFWMAALRVDAVNSLANMLFLIVLPAVFCFALAILDKFTVGRIGHFVEESK